MAGSMGGITQMCLLHEVKALHLHFQSVSAHLQVVKQWNLSGSTPGPVHRTPYIFYPQHLWADGGNGSSIYIEGITKQEVPGKEKDIYTVGYTYRFITVWGSSNLKKAPIWIVTSWSEYDRTNRHPLRKRRRELWWAAVSLHRCCNVGNFIRTGHYFPIKCRSCNLQRNLLAWNGIHLHLYSLKKLITVVFWFANSKYLFLHKKEVHF